VQRARVELNCVIIRWKFALVHRQAVRVKRESSSHRFVGGGNASLHFYQGKIIVVDNWGDVTELKSSYIDPWN
jgi:hypothetical protein